MSQALSNALQHLRVRRAEDRLIPAAAHALPTPPVCRNVSKKAGIHSYGLRPAVPVPPVCPSIPLFYHTLSSRAMTLIMCPMPTKQQLFCNFTNQPATEIASAPYIIKPRFWFLLQRRRDGTYRTAQIFRVNNALPGSSELTTRPPIHLVKFRNLSPGTITTMLITHNENCFFFILDTETKNPEPGLVPGSGYLVPGSWRLVLGSWFQVPGT